jgi:hypothetical protein
MASEQSMQTKLMKQQKEKKYRLTPSCPNGSAGCCVTGREDDEASTVGGILA